MLLTAVFLGFAFVSYQNFEARMDQRDPVRDSFILFSFVSGS
jgi:hypothetical protein